MAIQHYFDRAKTDYDETYEAGKKAEWNEFWDNYQTNGKRVDYNHAFYGKGWTDKTYNPKYPIVAGQGNTTANTFSWNDITDTKVTVDISKSTSEYLFANTQKLITVRKLIVSETSKYSVSFSNCYALENLTIEGVVGNTISIAQSKKLSKASIISVINALSATKSGLTATFSQAAVETAFGSTTSTEWLELVATKPNWTISLA